MKDQLSVRFAELVYNGQWVYPHCARRCRHLFSNTQLPVDWHRLSLNCIKGKTSSLPEYGRKNSLYSEEIATFGESDEYDQEGIRPDL
jgi:argininosuccinate synthase